MRNDENTMIHKSYGVRQRAVALIASGMLAVSTLAAPAAALAADVGPSAGGQTGKGVTDVTVQAIAGSDERGGTEVDPQNPRPDDSTDPDDPGKNIAFTVPSAINFVSDAQGNLTGPSPDATYIENRSVFGIRASSFDVDPAGGWTIVENGGDVTAANSADFQFGPEQDVLDAYNYLDKTDVNTPNAWSMAAYDGDESVADRVSMQSAGTIYKVNGDITSKTKIATIKTYVKASNAD